MVVAFGAVILPQRHAFIAQSSQRFPMLDLLAPTLAFLPTLGTSTSATLLASGIARTVLWPQCEAGGVAILVQNGLFAAHNVE
jgi:hypothetical protein